MTERIFNLHEVIYQEWLESERGWGIRPDGYSIHISIGDLVRFTQQYWDAMPYETPDEYSSPNGEPMIRYIPSSLYEQLLEAKAQGKFGLRFFQGELD